MIIFSKQDISNKKFKNNTINYVSNGYNDSIFFKLGYFSTRVS